MIQKPLILPPFCFSLEKPLTLSGNTRARCNTKNTAVALFCWLRYKFNMADEEVKIFDNQDDKITASSRTPVCFFCHKSTSKYTCPRCNAGYCSVSCYNSEKHVQCSEGFYKGNVLDELTQRTKDPEDVQRVLSMLKNLEEENVEGEETGESSLEERLAGVDLDKADPSVIWENMTKDEKEDFESSIKSGRLSQMIGEWIPWWQTQEEPRYGHCS